MHLLMRYRWTAAVFCFPPSGFNGNAGMVFSKYEAAVMMITRIVPNKNFILYDFAGASGRLLNISVYNVFKIFLFAADDFWFTVFDRIGS